MYFFFLLNFAVTTNEDLTLSTLPYIPLSLILIKLHRNLLMRGQMFSAVYQRFDDMCCQEEFHCVLMLMPYHVVNIF